MAHLLGAENIAVDFPTRRVFDSVTVGVDEGDRIGIVGRNGDGKSTLLSVLAGRLTPDAGRVTHRGGLRIGVLDQTDQITDTTVGAAIVGDRPDHVWAGDPAIRDVINGLVSDLPWDAPISSLSGGQQRRVALAALLVGDWDVVMLDEPTNHLDVEGITWLAEHLRRRWRPGQGALLLVTHDRWFLDEVATSTWEVHDGIVEPFEGGYAAYVLARVERDRQAAATEAKRQNLMRKELAWLRRGAPARTSKPKFRIDAANQLIEDVPPVRDRIELTKLATARLGKDVVDLLDVGVRFGDKQVLQDITWRIAPGERTGILGANGAGKSTLLGVVADIVKPTSGRVKRGKTVQLAILDQRMTQLEPVKDEMVRDVLARTQTTYVVDGKEMTPAQLLERLGFQREQLSTRVGELSGGQQRRLQLLLILLSEPNVLILDEPTNDVDTDMLTAMEDLLDSWPGTLIVVSHDRYLIERVTDQQYAVWQGGLRHLPGGVDEYLSLRKASPSKDAAPQPTSGGSSDTEHSGAQLSGAQQSGAQQSGAQLSGAERQALRKELTAAERRMSKIDDLVAGLHTKMAAHDQDDYAGLASLTTQVAQLESEKAELEDRWLELSDTLE